jgi:hypothetical protein
MPVDDAGFDGAARLELEGGISDIRFRDRLPETLGLGVLDIVSTATAIELKVRPFKPSRLPAWTLPIRLRSSYTSVYNVCLSTTVLPSQLLAKACWGLSAAARADTPTIRTMKASVTR